MLRKSWLSLLESIETQYLAIFKESKMKIINYYEGQICINELKH